MIWAVLGRLHSHKCQLMPRAEGSPGNAEGQVLPFRTKSNACRGSQASPTKRRKPPKGQERADSEPEPGYPDWYARGADLNRPSLPESNDMDQRDQAKHQDADDNVSVALHRLPPHSQNRECFRPGTFELARPARPCRYNSACRASRMPTVIITVSPIVRNLLGFMDFLLYERAEL